MADQVHLFNGVRYDPIKAIRDSDGKWLSAGWLSKQMSLNNYNKTKPANIGIAVNPGQGSRVGDYMVLEEAINCIPLPKQAEARHFFGLVMEEATPQVHRAVVWRGFLFFKHCALLNPFLQVFWYLDGQVFHLPPPIIPHSPHFPPFPPIFPHFPPFFLSEREVERVTEVPP